MSISESTDPIKANLWADVPNGHTGKNRLVITGLIPEQIYYFRMFTEFTAGSSAPMAA